MTVQQRAMSVGYVACGVRGPKSGAREWKEPYEETRSDFVLIWQKRAETQTFCSSAVGPIQSAQAGTVHLSLRRSPAACHQSGTPAAFTGISTLCPHNRSNLRTLSGIGSLSSFSARHSNDVRFAAEGLEQDLISGICGTSGSEISRAGAGSFPSRRVSTMRSWPAHPHSRKQTVRRGPAHRAAGKNIRPFWKRPERDRVGGFTLPEASEPGRFQEPNRLKTG